MPPGAKKSWRFGRFSGGAGVIEMGVAVDNVEFVRVVPARMPCNFYNRGGSE
jgi:hypothetical protein